MGWAWVWVGVWGGFAFFFFLLSELFSLFFLFFVSCGSCEDGQPADWPGSGEMGGKDGLDGGKQSCVDCWPLLGTATYKLHLVLVLVAKMICT